MYYGTSENPPDQIVFAPGEEKILWRAYRKSGDVEALRKLVLRYLPYAFSIASKFKGPRLSFEDATSAANAGLMEAISTFVPSKGKFIVYCYWPIRRHTLEALLATYPVKLGSRMRKNIRKKDLSGNNSDLNEAFARLGTYTPLQSGDTSVGYSQGAGTVVKDSQSVDHVHWSPVVQALGPQPTADVEDFAPSHVEAVERADEALEVRHFIETDVFTAIERAVLKARHYVEPPEGLEHLAKRLNQPKRKLSLAYDSALLKLKTRFNAQG